MLRVLGRGMQQAALIALPVAMFLQMAGAWSRGGEQSVSQPLFCLFGAVCLFLIGRLVEGYAPR